MAELPELKLKDRGNKWLVRSALQKAIRRGRVEEALKAGGFLFTENPSYFWRSLATIAIEDVGPANVGSVSKTFELLNAGLKDPRTKDRQVIGDLIEQLCEGPKSRLCCEISVVGDFSQKDLFHEWAFFPTKLVERALKESDLVKQYVALSLIFGTSRVNRKKLTGLVLDVLGWVSHHKELHEFDKEMLMQVLHNPFDGMCVAMLPALLLVRQEEKLGNLTLVKDSWPEEVSLRNLSSAAYDMHVAEGKKAIKAFYTSMKKRKFVVGQIPEDDAVKALGAIIFVLEGGQVDRRLSSPELIDWKAKQDRELMLEYGVPKDLMSKLIEEVRDEWPRLVQKREWVVSSLGRDPDIDSQKKGMFNETAGGGPASG